MEPDPPGLESSFLHLLVWNLGNLSQACSLSVKLEDNNSTHFMTLLLGLNGVLTQKLYHKIFGNNRYHYR